MDVKMKINKSTLLWIIIAILAILVIYVVFFQSPSTGSNVVASATQAGAQQAASYGGMVGGC